jgi:hypothetical protein
MRNTLIFVLLSACTVQTLGYDDNCMSATSDCRVIDYDQIMIELFEHE